MPDRNNPPRGPEEGTPEYNWLYGTSAPRDEDDWATQLQQPDTGPDATRRMPVQPRAQQPGAPGGPTRPTTQPYQAPPPPGGPRSGQPRSGPGRPRLPRRPRPLRFVKYVLLLWLVFLVATPFWAWTKFTKVDVEPTGQRPADQPGTTYLLVGSDSREGLTPEEQRRLGTGSVAGQRTDTIMLLHTGDGPNLLMSIPRDSWVDIPGSGRGKINGAYAKGGPKLLVRTIEDNTGIRIDHYVEIGFGGFVGLVDAVGGVEICPTQDMTDVDAALKIKKGCQEVEGKTALGYARSRKTSGLGDIDRAKHQREVVSAVGKKAMSPWTVINPIRWWRVNFAAADFFTVSEGTGPVALGNFGLAMTRVNGSNGLTCGVPIANLSVDWDRERSRRMFDLIINDKTDEIGGLCTKSGLEGKE